ncbi:MAG: SAM-dependent chlorinase/fluorinase [Desulfobacterales bacterium]|nr:SAM-dependent chlorinase/fluorinase [Desulfobacterales bacterium]
MNIITLLTDFGLNDAYVGIMKGVILSINPYVQIIDISHSVTPQDITQSAYLISSAYKYFPQNTIHIVVVDPGVGSQRQIIAAKINGHIFICSNNGILSLIMDKNDVEIEEIICIDNDEYFLKPVSKTFHGRDIFAPIAAHLSKGIPLKKIGTAFNQDKVVKLNIAKPFISTKNELIGQVVHIDHFGNLITNIDSETLRKFNKIPSMFKILINSNEINGIFDTYTDVEIGQPIALIGSSGFLEISVNSGKGSDYFNVKNGVNIKIQTKTKKEDECLL